MFGFGFFFFFFLPLRPPLHFFRICFMCECRSGPGIENLALHQAPYLATLALRMSMKKTTQPPLSRAVRRTARRRPSGNKERNSHSCSSEATVPGRRWGGGELDFCSSCREGQWCQRYDRRKRPPTFPTLPFAGDPETPHIFHGLFGLLNVAPTCHLQDCLHGIRNHQEEPRVSYDLLSPWSLFTIPGRGW